MAKKLIKLSSQEELKIFMSPQRQRLLRTMSIRGEALTPKAVADMLDISASSAQFHIKKLEKLGIVELDHTEVINGILAKYYKLADADVSIVDEEFSNERTIIIQNLIKHTLGGLVAINKKDLPAEEKANSSEFLNGVLHLSQKDALDFIKLIREFIDTHEKKDVGTEPWEYTFMIYNTEK